MRCKRTAGLAREHPLSPRHKSRTSATKSSGQMGQVGRKGLSDMDEGRGRARGMNSLKSRGRVGELEVGRQKKATKAKVGNHESSDSRRRGVDSHPQ